MLDSFTHSNIVQWAKASASMERYHLGLHYALEAQRKHDRGDLYRALEPASHVKAFEFADWVRVSSYRYSDQPLNAFGSTIGAGGRFNYGDALDNIDAIAFPALYLGANQTVACREHFGLAPNEHRALTEREFLLLPKKDIAVVHVSGEIHNVLDITRAANLERFVQIIKRYSVSSNVVRLAEDAGIEPRTFVDSVKKLVVVLSETRWRAWPCQFGLPANCQIFGKLVWEAGYEALLYPSAKGGGKCLAVYPQNLQKSESRIWLSGTPPPGVLATLDASNWQMAISA